MRPNCIQILFPHGTGAVEGLGINIGKKTDLADQFEIDHLSEQAQKHLKKWSESTKMLSANIHLT